MKRNLLMFSLLQILLHQATAQTASPIPKLEERNGRTQLIVDGKGFIIAGGELGNSTASSTKYMDTVWPKLERLNLNTVVAPVYWELMEPLEGKFDFDLVDDLIKGARKHNMKLVLLWFGIWKNSMSCYAPAWMKTNQARFPRTENHSGRKEEIITPFSKNALDADVKAFKRLMEHIKTFDSTDRTVLMVQVENEIGMLPEARDFSPAANEAFKKPVPNALMNHLSAHQNTLAPEIKELWAENGSKKTGSWEEIFGKGAATEELFMAWHFGVFVEELTKAGKSVYPLPMYVNAALNAPGKKPGQYPSAGPLPHVLDIWKAAAPSVDFFSPDFYNPDFKHWNDLYTRNKNTLFIPEHAFNAGVDAKALYAIGHYKAIGFSPFSIESKAKPEEEPLGKAYQVIRQLTDVISATPANSVEGVLISNVADSVHLKMGDYLLTVKHDLTLSWTAKPADGKWPLTGAVIISIADNEFYVGGTGIVVTFKPLKPGKRVGILQLDEGVFTDGKWTPGRRLNGDEDHQGRHLSIPSGEFAIQRVQLYDY